MFSLKWKNSFIRHTYRFSKNTGFRLIFFFVHSTFPQLVNYFLRLLFYGVSDKRPFLSIKWSINYAYLNFGLLIFTPNLGCEKTFVFLNRWCLAFSNVEHCLTLSNIPVILFSISFYTKAFQLLSPNIPP